MFALDRYNGDDFQVQDFADDTGSTYPMLTQAYEAGQGYNNNMGYWVIAPDGIVDYYSGVHVMNIAAKQYAIEQLLLELDAPEPTPSVPEQFTLSQAYPNPFNGTVRVDVTLPANDRVRLSVLDLLGREVTRLEDADLTRGVHHYSWQPRHAAAGSYLIRVDTGRHGHQTQRVIYLK